ncbi:MAG: VWA domain-containing protein [Endomicrobia bacterium]|nr:VWA domain-containing protein [Endomicrobiia bacterium]
MLYFYNKLILFLLPFSLLPILLHLLSQKKSRLVKFTYVNLIQKVLKIYSPKKKIIDILVVILRCLIIFFIVLFIARPIMYHNPDKKNTLNLLIAIDTSFSMKQKLNNITKFDLSKFLLLDILKELQNYNVKLQIVSFDEGVVPVSYGFSKVNSEVLNKLENINVSYKATNINSIFNYINDHFSNDNFIDKVIIFTDAARHIMSTNVEDKQVLYSNIKNTIEVLFCYPNFLENNAFIEDLKLSLKDEDIFEIIASFKVSPENKIGLDTKVFINDNLYENRNIVIPSLTEKFQYILDEEKIVGYFLIANDALNEDNYVFFTYSKPKDKKVICLTDEPLYLRGYDSVRFYLEKLNLSGIKTKVISLQDTKFVDYSGELVLSVGIDRIEDISRYINDVSGHIIFLDDTINIESYERYLNGIEFMELQENTKGYTLEIADDKDFNKFLEEFEYKKIKTHKRFLITITGSKKGWKIIARYNDGIPAILERSGIYLCNFPLNKNYSNFIYKPMFVGMLDYIIKKYQVDFLYTKPFYSVSEDIFLKGITEIVPIKVLSNSNSYYDKLGDFVKFNVPGLYKVTSLENRVDYVIAININPNESTVEILEKSQLRRYLKNLKIDFIDINNNKAKQQILQWCFGKEISDNFLVYAFLCFIIETIISRFGRRII